MEGRDHSAPSQRHENPYSVSPTRNALSTLHPQVSLKLHDSKRTVGPNRNEDIWCDTRNQEQSARTRNRRGGRISKSSCLRRCEDHVFSRGSLCCGIAARFLLTLLMHATLDSIRFVRGSGSAVGSWRERTGARRSDQAGRSSRVSGTVELPSAHSADRLQRFQGPPSGYARSCHMVMADPTP